MKPELIEALKPDLQPLIGDHIEFAGKRGGNSQTWITWQGLRRSLTQWSLTLDVSKSCLDYRIRNMSLEGAMDMTKKPQMGRIKKQPKKEYKQGVDYIYIAPAEALL